jgi:hypothetical protein
VPLSPAETTPDEGAGVVSVLVAVEVVGAGVRLSPGVTSEVGAVV